MLRDVEYRILGLLDRICVECIAGLNYFNSINKFEIFMLFIYTSFGVTPGKFSSVHNTTGLEVALVLLCFSILECSLFVQGTLLAWSPQNVCDS